MWCSKGEICKEGNTIAMRIFDELQRLFFLIFVFLFVPLTSLLKFALFVVFFFLTVSTKIVSLCVHWLNSSPHFAYEASKFSGIGKGVTFRHKKSGYLFLKREQIDDDYKSREREREREREKNE